MSTLFKSHTGFFLISLLLVSILGSCDDCEDCSPSVTQPSFQAIFINQDSLNHLNDSLDIVNMVIDENDSLLNDTNALIADFTDSLLNVEIGIDTGNINLEEIRDILADTIEILEGISNEYETIIDSLDNTTQELNLIVDIINSGNVLVEQITNLINQESVTYEDSSTVWSLPIDLNKDSVRYRMRIKNQEYDISIRYSRNQDVNFRREVILSIENIVITDYSGFDTVTVNEKTFTLFF